MDLLEAFAEAAASLKANKLRSGLTMLGIEVEGVDARMELTTVNGPIEVTTPPFISMWPLNSMRLPRASDGFVRIRFAQPRMRRRCSVGVSPSMGRPPERKSKLPLRTQLT